MASSSSCQAYDEAVQLNVIATVLSVAFTFLVRISYLCLKRRLDGAPGLLAQFYFVASGFKLTMAVVLLTVLVPKCPSNCFCADDQWRWYIYPPLAILISVLWFMRGIDNLRQARALSKPGDVGQGADSSIYARAPTSSIEVV